MIEAEILFFSFYTEREVSKISQFSIQHIDLERYVPPVLRKIAYCESGNRQFYAGGSLVRGKINSQDIGKYQINEKYHLETAKKLGLDIYTEYGNTLYALYLFQRNGTKDWGWSKNCWQ